MKVRLHPKYKSAVEFPGIGVREAGEEFELEDEKARELIYRGYVVDAAISNDVVEIETDDDVIEGDPNDSRPVGEGGELNPELGFPEDFPAKAKTIFEEEKISAATVCTMSKKQLVAQKGIGDKLADQVISFCADHMLAEKGAE